eukprot:12690642-Alexandrium_andersonii.AAC.1
MGSVLDRAPSDSCANDRRCLWGRWRLTENVRQAGASRRTPTLFGAGPAARHFPAATGRRLARRSISA